MKLSYHPPRQASTVQRKVSRLPCACTLAFIFCLSAHSSAYAFEWFGLFGSEKDQPATIEAAPAEQSKKPVLIDQPHPIEDLAYGDLLFDFYQQKYFSSISKILVAKERGQLQHNGEQAELVLGSLYVSYGMLDQGEAIFNRLLNTYSSPKGADESWYQLARIYYKRGNPQKALAVLDSNIVEPLATRSTEHVLLQMLCHIKLGQVDQARALTQYLSDDDSQHSIFVQFNLGAALSELGDMEGAAVYFQNILENNQPGNEIDRTLTDRAALSLGVYYLHAMQPELAAQTLSRIRLFGPVANQGLLALGWAYFESGNKIDALTPWMELNSRALSDQAVQESVLNVPYIYEELGALQDALDGYNNAYKTFENESKKLDAIKTEILQPEWIEIISPADTAEMNVLNSVQNFEIPPDNAASIHLYRYYATNEFQRMYQDYRELQRLYLVLINWERQLPTFNEMVQTNVERLNDLSPKSERATQQAKQFYAYSKVKLDEFEAKLNRIIADDDIAGTADMNQLAQLSRLNAIEANLKSMGNPDDHSEEWEKFRLLKGLLVWDMNALAIEKRWQGSKDKIAINNLLIELETRIQALSAAREERLGRFQGFENRISELRLRLKTLQEQTAMTLRDQRNLMQKVAVGIIENQQTQLDRMRAKSLLAIARLQDLAYTQEREREKQRDQGVGIDPAADPNASGGGVHETEPNPDDEPSKTLIEAIDKIFKKD